MNNQCSSEFLIRKGGFTTQVQIQELQHHLSQGLTTGIAIVPGTNITREQIHAGLGVSAGRALVSPRSLRFFGVGAPNIVSLHTCARLWRVSNTILYILYSTPPPNAQNGLVWWNWTRVSNISNTNVVLNGSTFQWTSQNHQGWLAIGK